jgi:aryl-alcohol dehydrogenase-like predicted oxidoreductase
MRRITLHRTSWQTSAAGFGCVGLTLLDDPAGAVALLEAAFAEGITHFDVARSYGFGQAEGILGRFLQGKRDRVTVTTKFGIAPIAALARRQGLVSLARKIVHRFPILRKAAARGARSMTKAAVFDPAVAAANLEQSLRELRTDYVDLYLLHEAELADAKGVIRNYGVGSAASKLRGDFTLFPAAYQVFQFDHHFSGPDLATLPGASQRGMITHSCFNGGRALVAAAGAQPETTRRFSEEIGLNLADPAVLRDLLWQQAALANPRGIVLFGTSRSEHLRQNVRAFNAPPPTPAQLAALAAFVRAVLPTSETRHDR